MRIITQQQEVAYTQYLKEVENECCPLEFEDWYVYYCYENSRYIDT